jgi:lipoprotein-anchoring transpeptidase ErfK/SrfK
MKKKTKQIAVSFGIFVFFSVVGLTYFVSHDSGQSVTHFPIGKSTVSQNSSIAFGKGAVSNTLKPNRGIASVDESFTRLDAIEYDPCGHFMESDDEDENDPEKYEECMKEIHLNNVSLEGVKYPYLSELSEQFTPDIEAQFDVFLVVNTEDRKPGPIDMNNVGVPRQHVRVFVKKRTGTGSQADNIFIRDSNGEIVGVNESKINTNIPQLAALNKVPSDIADTYHRYNKPYLIPTTTGKSGSAGYMKTTNGLYLVNEQMSDSHLKTSPEASMSYQTYIDTRYRDGQESHIAIHGVPARERGILGAHRGSHGCARVHPEHAKAIRNFLQTLEQRPVPDLKWKDWLSYQLQPSPLASAKVMRIPVLFVIFNGYEPSHISQALNNTFEFNVWESYASR